MPDGPAIAPGMRVRCRDAEWLVVRVDPSDALHRHHAVHCVGADDLVRGHESIFLTQLDAIEPVDPRRTRLADDRSGGFVFSKLYIDARLRQTPATGLEPDLNGLGVFRSMRFQIEAVRLALSQLRPRLLLADAVGLGKTIQVGMILTELLRRGRADRILVLAKKSMLRQFQAELWNRFAIPLIRLDSRGIARLRLQVPASRNPFDVYHRVIVSIDTLKDLGRWGHFLEHARWDVVVIDEAHNVAGASVPEKHLSYRLARLLARRTESLLLTTATPHNGRKETFGRLISLLDPFAIPDARLEDYDAQDIRGLFLMRFKEDVKEDAGTRLTDRRVVPLGETTAAASTEEETVYSALADLRAAARDIDGIRDGASATGSGRSWARLPVIQYGLYKQFLSSPESCRETVDRRLERCRVTSSGGSELRYLERLARSLAPMRLARTSRYDLLRRQLRQMGWTGDPDSPRVLVFTEYRATQRALARAIAEDYELTHSEDVEDPAEVAVATIHGSSPDAQLMRTIEAFGTGSSRTRLLIATDVVSEGINLHHECHHIIHYDLPWSIITLIQRNGRVDRFGQTSPPVLRYLMVSTDQGLLDGDRAIFERLVEKVEEINRSTRSGESVLRLYDPEAEARFLAEHGVLSGDTDVLEKAETRNAGAPLETLIDDARVAVDRRDTPAHGGEIGHRSPENGTAGVCGSASRRLRLFSDREFLVEGSRHLRGDRPDDPPLEEAGGLVIFTAPRDLELRLGAPGACGDVVFGATAVPPEAWPEDGRFRLTSDPERAERAIARARHLGGLWSEEMLCCEQHPILQWIAERLAMRMDHDAAPRTASRGLGPGERCFVFVGQIGAPPRTPLLVDAHVMSFHGDALSAESALSTALARWFDHPGDVARLSEVTAAEALVPVAVEASLARMRRLQRDGDPRQSVLRRREENRRRRQLERRRGLSAALTGALGDAHPRSRRQARFVASLERALEDGGDLRREVDEDGAFAPSTQLLLVIEGVGA